MPFVLLVLVLYKCILMNMMCRDVRRVRLRRTRSFV
jgi:hypothetical protein